MAKIIIPFPFRKYTDSLREVLVESNTLADCLEALISKYPGMTSIQDHPALLSIFINGKQTKKEWHAVSLTHEDEVSLIVPIAGG